jgi:GxxExxY protein
MGFDVNRVQNSKLLYPEESYVINGALIKVAKALGPGLLEKHYQNALKMELKKTGLAFSEQFYVPIKYDGVKIGCYYLDFLVEGKIVVELKRGKFVPAHIMDQTKNYMKILDMKLGIIGCFTYSGVILQRVLNEY